jgi:spermidine synthase
MRQKTEFKACGAAFLVAFFTLFAQILIHRIVSAKLQNNLAFFVISLTMLGFALSGVILARVVSRAIARLDDWLATCAAALAVTMLAITAAFYWAPASIAGSGRVAFVLSFLSVLPYALMLSIPFVACGLMLGTLLALPTVSSRNVYFADLAGSAIGALCVLPAISLLGAENALIGACALVLAGTALLTTPRRPLSRALTVVAAATILVAWIWRDDVFRLRHPRGSFLNMVAEVGEPFHLETVAWDGIARIELVRTPPVNDRTTAYPCLIGDQPAFHRRITRVLTQNNYAFTYAPIYDGTRESLRGIERTIYASAYHASSVRRPSVAIVGVGGGIDVLTALAFDATHVTAIEINPATIAILRRHADLFRHWIGDPAVDLQVDEGRQRLSRLNERFDILQLSGVDSYTGTAAAAHVFSENYLYTSEAFDLYLSRLSDQGILNMMRLEYSIPREMLRGLVTAVAALRRQGVPHPAAHIVTLTAAPNPNFTALLVKKAPFSADELAKLAAWTAQNPYVKLSAAPGLPPDASEYQRFLMLDDPRLERAYARTYPWDIRPTTDDRPFFFRHSYWWHVFATNRVLWASVPVMEYSLLVLLLVIALAVVLCIYLPLRFLCGKAPEGFAARRHAVYFAGCGIGYLAIEVAYMQRFGLFLGHPNYALSVVLATLLFCSGLGSMASRQVSARLGGQRWTSYLLAFMIFAQHFFLLPRLEHLTGLPFILRVAVVVLVIAPVGFCLGTYIPSALERLKVVAPAYVPWAWGINGIFSVLAPVLSVAVSMTWGIEALLLSSVPVYLVTGLALPETQKGAERTN